MTYLMAKKRKAYRLDEGMITAMEILSAMRRWDQTTVVEVAIESLLKQEGVTDELGRLTDVAKEKQKELQEIEAVKESEDASDD